MGYDPREDEPAQKLGQWMTGAYTQGLFEPTTGWEISKGEAIQAWLDQGKKKGILALVGRPTEADLRDLEDRFQRVRAWLLAVVVGGLVLATLQLRADAYSPDYLAATVGLVGSGIAALISCLDRRANGFEADDGKAFPDPAVKKERFGKGMSEWLITRPVLGLFMGWLVYFGLESGVLVPGGRFDAISSDKLVFWAALAGLFSKTLYEILLGLLKSFKPGK